MSPNNGTRPQQVVRFHGPKTQQTEAPFQAPATTPSRARFDILAKSREWLGPSIRRLATRVAQIFASNPSIKKHSNFVRLYNSRPQTEKALASAAATVGLAGARAIQETLAPSGTRREGSHSAPASWGAFGAAARAQAKLTGNTPEVCAQAALKEAFQKLKPDEQRKFSVAFRQKNEQLKAGNGKGMNANIALAVEVGDKLITEKYSVSALLGEELKSLQSETSTLRPLRTDGHGAAPQPETSLDLQLWKDAARSIYTASDDDITLKMKKLNAPEHYHPEGASEHSEVDRAQLQEIRDFASVATHGDFRRLNQVAKFAQQGLLAGLCRLSLEPNTPLRLEGRLVGLIAASGEATYEVIRESDDSHLVRVVQETTSQASNGLGVRYLDTDEDVMLPPGSSVLMDFTVRVKGDGSAAVAVSPKLEMRVAQGPILGFSDFHEHEWQQQAPR